MNLGEDEAFVFKHPYFFENVSLKFEGWEPELQRLLEKTVKDMGGKISDVPNYVITEHVYSKKQAIMNDRSSYYSVIYLTDSIEAEIPLDIEEYRYVDLEAKGNPLGLGCCCYDIRTAFEANFGESYDDKYTCTLCLDNQKALVSYDNWESDESSDIEIIDVPSNETGDGGSKLKRKQPVSHRNLKKKSRQSPNDKTQWYRGALMQDIPNWWFNLPPGRNPDPNYKEKEVSQPFRERDYVDNEKMVMIAYLIKNNLFDDLGKRKTWRNMHRDGYLRVRSIDSLKTQIKVIVEEIEGFQLPKSIERKFLSLRGKLFLD